MSFEITDVEAEEIYFTEKKKLAGVKSILKQGEKGRSIHGKDKLLFRKPIMQELIDRLEDHYSKFKNADYRYPELEEE